MRPLLKKIIRLIKIPFILKDFFHFQSKAHSPRFTLHLKDAYPCVTDKTIETSFDRHYVYHTSWAARVLRETQPEKHVDIASSLFFAGIVSAFVPVEFYDYRRANIELSNLSSNEGDLMELPFSEGSVSSLSCMHVIEHIGLGRYGEPIDPDGDIKACIELSRVLARNGSLLFVTPVGKAAKIEYNAHRIYTYQAVLDLFPTLTLKEFSLIPEDGSRGGLIRNANPLLLEKENYACGCFVFSKDS